MSFGALDEFPAVALLEAADLLADRRLGDEILRRCERKTAGFGQVTEDLEGFNVHNS